MQLAVAEEMSRSRKSRKIVIVKDETTNRTATVEVDLRKERRDYEPIGLEMRGRIYMWMTIERCDGELNYRLKQTNGRLSDIFRAYDGARIYNHKFLDIYVSNPSKNGICRFIVGYKEED